MLEEGKTEQTALQKRPQESCVCPSAAKEALVLELFLKQQFWGFFLDALILSTRKYSIISKRINHYQSGHTCYRTRTPAWALLQKMTFSICIHTWISNFKCGKLSFNLSHWPNHKIISFCPPCIIFRSSSETTLSCALVWVKVSQATKKEWRKWWILIFRTVQGCSRAVPQSRSCSWLPPLTSQGKSTTCAPVC